MKFFPQQRVRIKRDAKPATDDLARLRGEIGRIVRPYTHIWAVEPWYQLDISMERGPVGAAESALEPIFDQPVKISWADSACVWAPHSMPAVIRRRVRA